MRYALPVIEIMSGLANVRDATPGPIIDSPDLLYGIRHDLPARLTTSLAADSAVPKTAYLQLGDGGFGTPIQGMLVKLQTGYLQNGATLTLDARYVTKLIGQLPARVALQNPITNLGGISGNTYASGSVLPVPQVVQQTGQVYIPPGSPNEIWVFIRTGLVFGSLGGATKQILLPYEALVMSGVEETDNEYADKGADKSYLSFASPAGSSSTATFNSSLIGSFNARDPESLIKCGPGFSVGVSGLPTGTPVEVIIPSYGNFEHGELARVIRARAKEGRYQTTAAAI